MTHTILILSSALKGGEKTHIDHITNGLKNQFNFITQVSHLNPFSLLTLYVSIKKHGVQIIHAHGYKALTQARLFKLIYWKCPPIIGTIHGFHLSRYPNQFKRLLRQILENSLCRIQTQTIAVSQSDYTDILKYTKTPKHTLTLIPNGVAPFKLAPEDQQAVISKLAEFNIDPMRHCLVLSVGSLEPIKGFKLLCNAMQDLVKNDPKTLIRCIILGDGPQKNFLRTRIADRHLDHHILLPGHQSNITTWLSLAKIYACPSQYEGLPYSVLEAMSVGLPVIAQEVPGLTDIVTHHKTGILVPKNNAPLFAEAIKKLAVDTTLWNALAHNAKKQMEQHHTLPNMLSKLAGLYQKHL